jgi:hypothetical protein
MTHMEKNEDVLFPIEIKWRKLCAEITDQELVETLIEAAYDLGEEEHLPKCVIRPANRHFHLSAKKRMAKGEILKRLKRSNEEEEQ